MHAIRSAHCQHVAQQHVCKLHCSGRKQGHNATARAAAPHRTQNGAASATHTVAKLPRPSLRTSRKCLCLQQAGSGHGKLLTPATATQAIEPGGGTRQHPTGYWIRQLPRSPTSMSAGCISNHQGTSTTGKPHMESTAPQSQQGPTHSSSSVSASCIRSLWLCLNSPLNFMAAHTRLDAPRCYTPS